MSDVIIRAEQLSKAYQIAHAAQTGGYKTIQEDVAKALTRFVRRVSPAAPRSETFWALKDVSFEVKRGEVLGIIGRNGAGKSTLLKLLSRISKPTSGRADIYGRVGSLLEVGTGFHPELTGRENIFLNGAILGMSRRDIEKQFDEIVAFAEVEQFLDTPVKRYSSGMYMRLAFAVAAHLEPEVLVIDEVLAVGDAKFQEKSLGKMGAVAQSGRTVLFVSHNMSAVAALCHKGLLLDKGRVVTLDRVDEVIRQYVSVHGMQSEYARTVESDGKLSIDRIRLLNEGEASGNYFNSDTLTVEIACTVRQPIAQAQIAFEVITLMNECLFSTTSLDAGDEYANLEPGRYMFHCNVPLAFMRPGQYSVKVSSSVPTVEILDVVHDVVSFEVIDDSSPILRLGQQRRGMILPLLSWSLQS